MQHLIWEASFSPPQRPEPLASMSLRRKLSPISIPEACSSFLSSSPSLRRRRSRRRRLVPSEEPSQIMAVSPEQQRQLRLQHSLSTPAVGAKRNRSVKRRVVFKDQEDIEDDCEGEEEEDADVDEDVFGDPEDDDELNMLIPPPPPPTAETDVFATSPFGRLSPAEVYWCEDIQDLLTQGRITTTRFSLTCTYAT